MMPIGGTMHSKCGCEEPEAETMIIVNLSPMSEKEKEQERLRQVARESHYRVSPDFNEDHEEVDMKTAMMEYEDEMIVRDPDMVLFEYMGAGPEMKEPAGLSAFKQDYQKYKKYGGDPVAMQLNPGPEPSYLDEMDPDDILSVTMDQTSMMDMSDPMNDAMAALEEQFGREAMATFEGEADGNMIFSVDSPLMGMVRFIYDSRAGVGRVMRG
tara:strand:+ start:3781 stop:4416 length:636 start_codon:yes stop_codon:yes gene_type:complete